MTGNRRFAPILAHPERVEKHILEDEAEARAYFVQVWAEAMELYRADEKHDLKLPKEMEDYLQKVHANITVAVMGCPVNGMQEASRADVGVAGGYEIGMLFRKGKLIRKVPQAELAEALKAEIEKIVAEEKA
jgi:hypothetical protein